MAEDATLSIGLTGSFRTFPQGRTTPLAPRRSNPGLNETILSGYTRPSALGWLCRTRRWLLPTASGAARPQEHDAQGDLGRARCHPARSDQAAAAAARQTLLPMTAPRNRGKLPFAPLIVSTACIARFCGGWRRPRESARPLHVLLRLALLRWPAN